MESCTNCERKLKLKNPARIIIIIIIIINLFVLLRLITLTVNDTLKNVK